MPVSGALTAGFAAAGAAAGPAGEAVVSGAAVATDPPCSASGAAAATATGAAMADGRAEDDRRAARADLELAEVAALEHRAEPVDERQQRRVGRRQRGCGLGGPGAAVDRRRLLRPGIHRCVSVPVDGGIAGAHGNGLHERLLLDQAGVGHGLLLPWRLVLRHPSHRRKTSAAFWPPSKTPEN